MWADAGGTFVGWGAIGGRPTVCRGGRECAIEHNVKAVPAGKGVFSALIVHRYG